MIEVEDPLTITADGAYNGAAVSVNQRQDGSWELMYYTGTSHTVQTGLVSKISVDQGTSWGPEVIPQQTNANLTHGVYMMRTPAGNLSAVADNAPSDSFARSTDSGANWSPQTQFSPTSAGGFNTIGYNSAGIMYRATYLSGNAFLWKSTDDGVSFTRLSQITSGGDPAVTETGVAKTPSGLVIAVSRDSGANTNTYVHFSSDNGVTWGASIDYTSQLGVLNLPQIIQVSNRLLLLARDATTKQLVSFISNDNGTTFVNRFVLDTYTNGFNDGGYCWPLVMDDGRVYVAFYAAKGGVAKPNIYGLKLKFL